jgi:hypothetical protein
MTEEIDRNERTGRAVEARLARLDPTPAEASSTEAALRRLQPRLREGSGNHAGRTIRRAAAVALPIAAVVAGVLLYAPTREALASFLDIFRVRQFHVVSVREDRIRQLEPLQEALRSGELLAMTVDREPGAPQPVADAAEASSIAGFRVLVPSELPAGAQRTEFSAARGPAMHADIDPGRIAAQLERAGLTGIELPALPAGTLRVDVPWVVFQKYRVEDAAGERHSTLELVQALSPEVTLPPGADLPALGETMLQVAGLPPDEARRMAQKIDWTSTLVLPMPENLGQFREIQIQGSPGVFVEGRRGGKSPGGSGLLWQRDGVLYSLGGERVVASELLRVAESMR